MKHNYTTVMIKVMVMLTMTFTEVCANTIIDNTLNNKSTVETVEFLLADNCTFNKYEGKTVASFVENADFSGMECVQLSKNIVKGKNVLTQDMVSKANTIYIILYDFDLNGAEITVPENCTFEFKGGSIYNGILNGALNNRIFDLENYGIVYGEEGALINGKRFEIFKGITTPLEFRLNGDVYITGNGSLEMVTEYLRMSSLNKYSLFLDNWKGFSVPNVEISNVKIISNIRNSVLVSITSNTVGSTFIIENSYVEGNIRVVTNKNLAIDCDHYFKKIRISDCEFESIHCSGGANEIFRFVDTIFDEVVITNNNIHNMCTTFINMGITNGSDYLNVIGNSKRKSFIKFNSVINDIDWKPWENESITPPGVYFCFCLIERGDCWVESNIFKNFLSYDDDISNVYDNYLSVSSLYYENNIWVNICNLKTGGQMMKSKAGEGKVRLYKNNCYLMEDVCSILGIESSTPSVQLIYFDNPMDYVELTNNKVQCYKRTFNAYSGLNVKTLRYIGNIFETTFGSGTGEPAYLPISHVDDSDWIIQNNRFIVKNPIETTLSIIASTPSTVGLSGNILIKDNVFTGVTSLTKGAFACYVSFINNKIYMNPHSEPVSSAICFDKTVNVSSTNDVFIVDNINVNVFYLTNKGSEQKHNVRFMFKEKRPNNMVFINGYQNYSDGIWNVRVKLKDISNNQMVIDAEYNVVKNEEGDQYCVFYDTNMNLRQKVESITFIYNDGNKSATINMNASGVCRILPTVIELNKEYEWEAIIRPIDNPHIL